MAFQTLQTLQSLLSSLSTNATDFNLIHVFIIGLAMFIVYICYLFASYNYCKYKYSNEPCIVYNIIGNKAGPIMIFIHGWPDLPYIWKAQVEYFQATHMCVLIELPNFHILKQQNPWGYDFKPITDAIAITIRSIIKQYAQYSMYKYEKVTIVGHDWGAFFTLLITSYYPELISKACVLDIGGGRNKTLPMSAKIGMFSYQMMNSVLFLMPHFLSIFLARFFIERILSKAMVASENELFPILKYEKECGQSFITPAANYLYFRLFWRLFFCDLHYFLPTAYLVKDIPFLFMRGKYNAIKFYSDRWLNDLRVRDDCQYLEVECGHWISTACPQRVNHALEKFIQSE